MQKFIGFIFLFCLTSLPIFADSKPISNPLAKEPVVFDVKAANKDFDKLNLKLSTQGLEQNSLKSAVKNLKELLNNAEECIRTNEKKISNLDSQIQETNQSNQATDNIDKQPVASKSAADLLYLTNERKSVAEKLSQCRLFSIRAKEALEVYESTLNRLKKEKILEHGEPFWDNIKQLFTTDITITKTPLKVFNIPAELLYPRNLYFIFSVAFILASLIFYKSFTSPAVRRYIHMKKVYLRSFTILLLALISMLITAYLSFLYYQVHNVSHLLLWLSTSLCVYLTSWFAIIVFFNFKKIKAFFCLYSLDWKFFKLLAVYILTLYTIAIIGKTLGKQLNIDNLVWNIGQSIFLYIELLFAIGFVFYFCHAHRQITIIKKYQAIIKLVSSIMFLSFAVINLIGYNLLSVHLTLSGILTFAIIFTTIILEQAIGKLYNLCIVDGPTRTKLKYIFGYKDGQTLTEILILKSTIQLIILIGAAYLITTSWGYAIDSIEKTFKYILDGIKFETFTFHPARIVSGIMIFCVLYLIFRSISTAISRHEQFDGEEETQVAIASILTYIGFGVAIISALLVSGFDFTGLAIVAGALSVGIGLGLQSIVNNFVSGIILLIEKPIKPGDRINIDGIEGYVKKIRVRSTQILTPTREDMIIPNSDLITKRVTNYMYSDKHLTIYCEMGLGYDNNLEFARSLLIDIANKHPEVITNIKNNKPRVFLRSFGENSILMQLWFLIKDGNKKVAVRSEIYFEIFKVFKENNISIAFPQRDLHVKVSDIETMKSIKTDT